MKLNVIDDLEKVEALVQENICPYCGKRTAKKLGDGVVGRFAPQTKKEAKLICYHCKNPDCIHMNYCVRRADVEDCMP